MKLKQRSVPGPAGRCARRFAGCRRPHAFTLFELLATLTVAGILVAVGVPSFSSFVQNDRLMTEVNSLVASLYVARSEAVKQDVNVTVCPSTNGSTCSGASNWSGGWIVLGAASATPLQVVSAFHAGNTLSEANDLASVTFQPSGLTSLMASGQAAKFTFCDARGAASARYTELAITGRVATSSHAGLDLAGGALSCP